jgi:hypothetical protein
VFGLIVVAGVAYVHQVPTRVTDEDGRYIELFLNELTADERALCRGLAKRSFDEQLQAIAAIQRMLIARCPQGDPIPDGRTREPKDLYQVRHGQCFDRSRVLEKIIRYLGLPTRHVFLLLRSPGTSTGEQLLTRRCPTHAVSEVKTAKAWIVVGSNHPWQAVDTSGQPCSISEMMNARTCHWKYPPPSVYGNIQFYVYGLYSRHGRFYPPYNAIPDVNYRELLYNLFD